MTDSLDTLLSSATDQQITGGEIRWNTTSKWLWLERALLTIRAMHTSDVSGGVRQLAIGAETEHNYTHFLLSQNVTKIRRIEHDTMICTFKSLYKQLGTATKCSLGTGCHGNQASVSLEL